MSKQLNLSVRVSDSCTLSDLLSFSLLKVKNLYTLDFSANLFKFEHKHNDYISKANGKLTSQQPLFDSCFIPSLILENSLAYCGYFLVEFPGGSFMIQVPSEDSNDPAGSQLSSDQLVKVVTFTSVLIIAARFGAESKLMRRLFKVMLPIISKFYQKEALFSWMHEQVKLVCVKQREARGYIEYLESIGTEIDPKYKEVELVARKRQAYDQEADIDAGEGLPLCISPDLEEDFVPNVVEIRQDLERVKERYEEEMRKLMKMIEGLDGSKKKTGFAIGGKFEEQCPVF